MKNKQTVQEHKDTAQENAQACAIHIIEEVIEPLLFIKYGDSVGIEGEEYYRIEEDVIALIDKYIK